MMYDVLVVGSGLSGAVIAEQITSNSEKKVLVIDKRDHIGGNCFDYIDENGIQVNKYGAHIFHTNNEVVWKYVQKFSKWVRWEHRVLAHIDNQYVPLPPCISTVNMLCGEHINTKDEMKTWVKGNVLPCANPSNSEEMVLSRVGPLLYEKIYKHYTFKQWNLYPDNLDASVGSRMPVRDNFDTRYFNDKYQALPYDGYTTFVKNVLQHPNITVKLNCDYNDHRDMFDPTKMTIYTGPIDAYFSDLGFPKLQYRSIKFEIHHIKDCKGYYQPCSVVNYPDKNVPFTRIIEYKHFLNQKSPHTTIVYETTTGDGDPYYPVPNLRNQQLYEKYQTIAKSLNNVHFVGRLATYKYLNMDEAIQNALLYYNEYIHHKIKDM